MIFLRNKPSVWFVILGDRIFEVQKPSAYRLIYMKNTLKILIVRSNCHSAGDWSATEMAGYITA
jgi:hypothetical protein